MKDEMKTAYQSLSYFLGLVHFPIMMPHIGIETSHDHHSSAPSYRFFVALFFNNVFNQRFLVYYFLYST
jgi:hypothetical protein